MIFYIYHKHNQEKFNFNELNTWFQSKTSESETIKCSINKNPFTNQESISVFQKGIWSLSITIVEGKETELNNKYFAKYLNPNKEERSIQASSTTCLYIVLNSSNSEYPEDCIEAMSLLEQLPNSFIFAPLAQYRKKMSSISKQVTKQKVSKLLEPILINALEKLGFVNKGKLLFFQSETRIIEVVFYKPSQLEDNLCTKASFCLYLSNTKQHRPIHTKEGFITWFVEPDGSNLEELVTDMADQLSKINDKWFEF
ncbi:MAG: hypothetical protein N4A49_11550 [Marinifilaceae bacterium]|jgi:hypothetical protein|nr:hypothetical protein [Marinifilaceae bacterium]